MVDLEESAEKAGATQLTIRPLFLLGRVSGAGRPDARPAVALEETTDQSAAGAALEEALGLEMTRLNRLGGIP